MPEEITDDAVVETAPEVDDATLPGWESPTSDTEIEAGSETSPTYKVTVGGEEVEVSLDEALAGYQRQSDYTQKTQDLAAQRSELEYAARLAMALETDPARAIEALREAYEVSNAAGTPAPAVDENLDPEEQRFATLETRLAAQEQAAFERQVNAQLATLHTQYGKFDDTELVRFAVERGIPNLDDAAKVFVFDKTFTKITADAKATAAKQSAPPVVGGHGMSAGSAVAGAATEKPTIREALEAAFAAHGS